MPCIRRMSDRRRSRVFILLQNFLREARARGRDLGRFADRDQIRIQNVQQRIYLLLLVINRIIIHLNRIGVSRT